MKAPNPPNQQAATDRGQMFSLPWLSFFTSLFKFLSGLPKSGEPLDDYADDTAAAAGGVPLYGYYRNGSIVMQRVV